MRKSYSATGFKPAAFGLPVHCSTTLAREDISLHALILESLLVSVLKNSCEEASSLAQVVEQWTSNPKAAGSNSVGRELFSIACFK